MFFRNLMDGEGKELVDYDPNQSLRIFIALREPPDLEMVVGGPLTRGGDVRNHKKRISHRQQIKPIVTGYLGGLKVPYSTSNNSDLIAATMTANQAIQLRKDNEEYVRVVVVNRRSVEPQGR